MTDIKELERKLEELIAKAEDNPEILEEYVPDEVAEKLAALWEELIKDEEFVAFLEKELKNGNLDWIKKIAPST